MLDCKITHDKTAFYCKNFTFGSKRSDDCVVSTICKMRMPITFQREHKTDIVMRVKPNMF